MKCLLFVAIGPGSTQVKCDWQKQQECPAPLEDDHDRDRSRISRQQYGTIAIVFYIKLWAIAQMRKSARDNLLTRLRDILAPETAKSSLNCVPCCLPQMLKL